MCPTDLAQVGQEWWAEAASLVALKVALPSAVKAGWETCGKNTLPLGSLRIEKALAVESRG